MGRDDEGMGLYSRARAAAWVLEAQNSPHFGGELGLEHVPMLALPSLWDLGSTFPSVRDSPEMLHPLLIASWWMRAVE